MISIYDSKNLSNYIHKKLRYKSYTLNNYRQISQIRNLSKEQQFEIEVVGHVFPFKTNNYVTNELINWEDAPNDPIFTLNFPQRDMLKPYHFGQMVKVLKNGRSKKEIEVAVNKIRRQLNPHPAGQMEHNVPNLDGHKLTGIQHKY